MVRYVQLDLNNYPMKIKGLLFVLLVIKLTNTYAQDTLTKRGSLAGYPIAFYTPETGFGAGGFAIYAFRQKSDSLGALPSQISLGGAYTTKNQILAYMPYQLFFDNRNWIAKGEVGYYRYFFKFFGVGNENPQGFEETFEARFPRVRFTGLKKIKNVLFGGVNYVFDGFNITDRDSSGMLIQDTITGSAGGRLSGFGPSLFYDSRDHVFFPTRGWLVDINFTHHGAFLGASYEYSKMVYDFSTYLKDKWENVWAFNFYGGFNLGNPPFNDMLEIGGTKKGRGYFQGTYRDRILNLLQAEYRFHVWKRFSATVFGSYGGVTDKIDDYQLKYLRYNYGAGIRFLLNKKEHINVRLDVALGKNTSGFYLTVGEAF